MNSSAKNGEITRETLQIREGRRELIRISLIRLSLLSPPNLLPRSTQLKPSTLRPSLRPISFPTYYVSPDAHPFSVHVGRRHVTRSGPIGLARGRVAGGRGRGSARLRIFLHLARGRSMYRAFLATNYIFSTVMATCVRSVCVCVCVQNHSSSLWLGRASRALYTIIVKNFRKIVSRNTCSFLEMLGRVEDPCAFASRIPTESEFRWIFFSSSPVTLAGRGFPVLLYQRSLVGSEIFWNTDIIERSFWIHDTREKFPLYSKRGLTSGKVISPRISSSRRIFDVSFGEIFEYTEYTDGRYKLLQTDCV